LLSTVVLDSSAILALILDEPGREIVAKLLDGDTNLSTVNLAEAHSRLILFGNAPELAWESLLGLGCEIRPFTEDHARIAAELIPLTKPYGLSLGDRACLALAINRRAPVYTTDRAWKNLSLGIEIEVIR
jgi:ribonuclease VapC